VSKHLQIGAPPTPAQAGEAGPPSAAPAARQRERSASALRLPAGDVERLVIAQMQALLEDRTGLLTMIQAVTDDGHDQKQMLDHAAALADEWRDLPAGQRRVALRRILDRVSVTRHQLELRIRPSRLAAFLDPARTLQNERAQEDAVTLRQDVKLQRAGLEMRFFIDGPGQSREPDKTLIKLILKAIDLRDTLIAQQLGVGDLAEREGVTSSYLTRIVRLAFLAPSIIAAILDGRQPPGLTAQKLILDSRLPTDWTQQSEQLGFT
jgi:AraC-like DNA-binding protein